MFCGLLAYTDAMNTLTHMWKPYLMTSHDMQRCQQLCPLPDNRHGLVVYQECELLLSGQSKCAQKHYQRTNVSLRYRLKKSIVIVRFYS